MSAYFILLTVFTYFNFIFIYYTHIQTVNIKWKWDINVYNERGARPQVEPSKRKQCRRPRWDGFGTRLSLAIGLLWKPMQTFSNYLNKKISCCTSPKTMKKILTFHPILNLIWNFFNSVCRIKNVNLPLSMLFLHVTWGTQQTKVNSSCIRVVSLFYYWLSLVSLKLVTYERYSFVYLCLLKTTHHFCFLEEWGIQWVITTMLRAVTTLVI